MRTCQRKNYLEAAIDDQLTQDSCDTGQGEKSRGWRDFSQLDPGSSKAKAGRKGNYEAEIDEQELKNSFRGFWEE